MDNLDTLLLVVSKMKTDQEKINYLLSYFYKTVEYNYAYLVGSGYMRGDINEVGGNIVIPNIYYKENSANELEKSQYQISCSPIVGNSKMFEEFCNIEKETNKDITELQRLLQLKCDKVMSKFLEKKLAHRESHCLFNKINYLLNTYWPLKTQNSNSFNKVYFSLPFSLIEIIINKRFPFEPEFKNGLIKRGVCKNYSDFLYKLFSSIGIKTCIVDCKTELDHQFVIIKVDGEIKVIDLTYAIFNRDGFKKNKDPETAKKWLYGNISDMFEMQPNRKLLSYYSEVNGELKKTMFNIPITIDNYTNYNFDDLFYEKSNKMLN